MANERHHVVHEEKLNITSVFDSSRVHALVSDDADSDEQVLAALGYKQQFKRDFSILQSFSVSFSVLGLLPSISSTLGYGLGYSGTGGAVWGWLVASLMIQATAFSLAELCSSMPTAGGLYYAAAVLAPEGWGPVASWFVGWSNFCGFVTGPCSLNYALASMILTAAEISNPDYTAQNWHIYLIFLLLIVLNGVLTMQSTRFIGHLNVFGTVWNLIVVIIFLIWFPVGSINTPKTNNSHDVWTTFENGTEWPIGWATIMGFLTPIFTMAGYDSPFHLSEECSNSNIASPRAIVMTAQFGLWIGWGIMMVIAYTVRDITEVVAGPYGQPFGSLCLQVLGQRSGLALFSLNMIASFFAGLGTTITASRILFAYSRDGALPFSKLVSKVNAKTQTPVISTWVVLGIAALLGLLMFGGPVAIGAVFTIAGIAQYTSFTTAIALKLFFGRKKFRRGPWHLGVFSTPLNAIAVGWWLLIVPALCFPAVRGTDLTPQTMNWTCLIYGGVMLIAMSYYAVDGRKWFRGPHINIEHREGTNAVDVADVTAGSAAGSADKRE